MEERENAKDRNKHPLSRVWRRDVFIRDNYNCQKCNQWGGKLCSHHIEDYANNKALRYDINNGVTLCNDCHISFHNTYGWKTCNREQINDYLKVKKQTG